MLTTADTSTLPGTSTHTPLHLQLQLVIPVRLEVPLNFADAIAGGGNI